MTLEDYHSKYALHTFTMKQREEILIICLLYITRFPDLDRADRTISSNTLFVSYNTLRKECVVVQAELCWIKFEKCINDARFIKKVCYRCK